MVLLEVLLLAASSIVIVSVVAHMPILSNMQEAVDQDGTPNSNIGGKVDRLSGTLENIAQNLGAVDDIINLA